MRLGEVAALELKTKYPDGTCPFLPPQALCSGSQGGWVPVVPQGKDAGDMPLEKEEGGGHFQVDGGGFMAGAGGCGAGIGEEKVPSQQEEYLLNLPVPSPGSKVQGQNPEMGATLSPSP